MSTHKILCWTVVIIWMLIIFSLSAQEAKQSSDLSSSITEIIVKVVELISPQADVITKNLNYIVRKSAHFFVYFILGILVKHAMNVNGLKGYKSIIIALLICFFYAVSDEIHQLFVPGRVGHYKDVLIDSCGASLGIGLYILYISRKVNIGEEAVLQANFLK